MGFKNKKILIGLAVLVALLCIFATVMADTIIATVAPDKYVLLSMLEMNKSADKENKVVSLSLNLKEIEGIYDDYLRDIIKDSEVYLSVSNIQDQEIMIDAAYSKNGTNLMNLSVYNSKDKLGIKIPLLLNQYVTVDLKNFKQEYDDSKLPFYLGNIEQENVDFINNYMEQIRKAAYGELKESNKKLSYDVQELLIQLAKDSSVKYVGKTKSMINNSSIPAKQFAITMDSLDVKSFVKDISKSIFKNTDLLNTIHTYNEYYSPGELEQLFYDTIDEIKFSDIELIFIIDNKRQIVGADINSSISVYDGNFSLDFKLSTDFLTNKDNDGFTLNAKQIGLQLSSYGETFGILGSASLKVNDLKDNTISISNEQQVDLFSMGISEMMDIASRMGSQFYDISDIINYIN